MLEVLIEKEGDRDSVVFRNMRTNYLWRTTNLEEGQKAIKLALAVRKKIPDDFLPERITQLLALFSKAEETFRLPFYYHAIAFLDKEELRVIRIREGERIVIASFSFRVLLEMREEKIKECVIGKIEEDLREGEW